MTIVTVLGAYLFGSVPFGFLIARLKGVDIRDHGSGNIGATNVTRVLGKPYGILCFVLDFAKGFVPVGIVLGLQHACPNTVAGWTPALAAAATVSGHVWPVYLRFKGGKGVATTVGALLLLAPVSVLIAGAGWVVVYKGTRYVSLASLTAAVLVPATAVALNQWTRVQVPASTVWLLAALGLLIIARHRSNIARLIQGTENRFAKSPKPQTAIQTDRDESDLQSAGSPDALADAALEQDKTAVAKCSSNSSQEKDTP